MMEDHMSPCADFLGCLLYSHESGFNALTTGNQIISWEAIRLIQAEHLPSSSNVIIQKASVCMRDCYFWLAFSIQRMLIPDYPPAPQFYISLDSILFSTIPPNMYPSPGFFIVSFALKKTIYIWNQVYVQMKKITIWMMATVLYIL